MTTHPAPVPHRPLRRGRHRLSGVLAATAVGALVLAGCGQADNAARNSGRDQASGDGVTLRLSWWGADARAELTEEVVARFEEQNPGVTVDTEWTTWDGYWDKLATSTAAGDMPDVVQMDESKIASYGSQGTLADLGAQPDVLDLGAVDEEVLATGDVDGTVMGAPVGVALFSVGVNPDVLERAGVPLPDDETWTWDEMEDAAAQVSSALGGEGVSGLDYFGMSTAELSSFARQQGQEVFPRDGQEPLSAQVAQDYFQLGLDMVASGATPAPSLQTETLVAPIEQSPFGTGKAAFHLQFHTQVQAFAAASGADMGLLRLPAARAGSPEMVNKASMYWSVASTSQHPEEAAALVDFLITDPEAGKVLAVERGVPAVAEVREAVRPQLEGVASTALDFAEEMQDEVVAPPQVTPEGASDFESEVRRIGSEVLFGSTSPADAAQAVLDVVERSQQ